MTKKIEWYQIDVFAANMPSKWNMHWIEIVADMHNAYNDIGTPLNSANLNLSI